MQLQVATSKSKAGRDMNSVTYSTLANVPKAKRLKIVSESKALLGCSRKCKEIWHAFRKADFRKEGILNEANMQLVFEGKNKQHINDMLRVTSVDEWITLFDRDRDGFLNEDEQISIFSLVKEKCQILCEELSAIHEYQMYKDLMKEIRALEKDIVTYQNELRADIHKRQLDEYVSIGQEKLKDFYREWEEKFEDFEKEIMNKIEELKGQHEQEMEDLNMRLDRAVEAVKVKPKAKLKELQTQEKLLAANERIEDAMNYRKELKDFEIEEAQRVENVRHHNAMKARNKLLSDQKKEMLQLEAKIETSRNNMRIRMDKELNTLQKVINLHVNDIKRIQGLMARLACKKGETYDELRRNKEMEKKTMKEIKNSKKIESGTDKTMKGTLVQTGNTITGGHGFNAVAASTLLLGGEFNRRNMMTGGMLSSSLGNTSSSGKNLSNTVRPLKYILSQAPLCNFDVSANSGQEKKPVNKQKDPTSSDMDLKGKIKKLLDQRKPPTEKMPSLCEMYDDDLNPIE